MKKLGVNIDHVATIRNARGGSHPDPLEAAKCAIKYGADSVTIHLREDRRHIKDLDLKKISNDKEIPLNLEIAANEKILKIALKNNPNYVCLVPEKRQEITTEGGLNLKKNSSKIKNILKRLKKAKIRTSLFINPTINDINLSKSLKDNLFKPLLLPVKKAMEPVKDKLNPDKTNASYLLGVKGLVTIGHGSSSAEAVMNSIIFSSKTVESGFISKFTETVSEL